MQIIDTNLFGGTDAQGNIKQEIDEDAILNAIKLWIITDQGEIRRNPNYGGDMLYWLVKPLTLENAKHIKTALEEGITQNFGQYVIVDTVDVDIDYSNSMYIIKMLLHIRKLNKQVSLEEKLKTLRQ